MNGQSTTIARLSRTMILFFTLFVLQATHVFGQTNYEKAKSALRAAVPVVLGLSSEEIVTSLVNDPTLSTGTWGPKYSAGLTFTDAVEWLKQKLAGSNYAAGRAAVINRAFQEVYGRDSTPAEQAYWETQVKAKQAWYFTIVTNELTKLNGDKGEQEATIQRAYQTSFGRAAKPGEVDYWLQRKPHYRPIVQANRPYLYSPGGATDLVETIARALAAKNGRQPTDGEVKAAMVKFTPKQLLYAEMIQ